MGKLNISLLSHLHTPDVLSNLLTHRTCLATFDIERELLTNVMKNCTFGWRRLTQVDPPAEEKAGISLSLKRRRCQPTCIIATCLTSSQLQHMLPHRDQQGGAELRTSEVMRKHLWKEHSTETENRSCVCAESRGQRGD